MTLNAIFERLGAASNYQSSPVKPPRLKLDANENLFLPAEAFKQILLSLAGEVDPRLYPSSEETKLRSAIAEANGVGRDEVVLGGGGDQLIGLLSSAVLRPGEGMLSLTPTFSVYPSAVKLRGIQHQEYPLLPSLELDPDALLSRVEGNTRLIAIVSPHNPTGAQFTEASIRAIIGGFNGLVLIDEAYVEYGRYNLSSWCSRYENLILLRTFSKAYGLAAMRVGYLLANRKLAELLSRAQDPFPVSTTSILLALALLQETELIEHAVEETKNTRRWLAEELSGISGVEALPSDANFITIKVGSPVESVWRKLAERGIAVRLVRDIPGRGSCLRVTIAPQPLLIEFLKTLKEVME